VALVRHRPLDGLLVRRGRLERPTKVLTRGGRAERKGTLPGRSSRPWLARLLAECTNAAWRFADGPADLKKIERISKELIELAGIGTRARSLRSPSSAGALTGSGAVIFRSFPLPDLAGNPAQVVESLRDALPDRLIVVVCLPFEFRESRRKHDIQNDTHINVVETPFREREGRRRPGRKKRLTPARHGLIHRGSLSRQFPLAEKVVDGAR
jgi:hypothetical protein